jgi:hypothetical protein
MEEAVFSVGTAAFIYLYAMAYQYGYQTPFGFLYLSLGPEKIVEIVRPVLLYSVSASAIALILGSVVRALLPGTATFRVATYAFLVAPIIIWVGIIGFIRVNMTEVGDLELLTALYLLLDRLLLECLRAWLGRYQQPITSSAFRYMQILVAGLMLIIIGYDQGKFEALNMAEADLCPHFANDTRDRIVVQRTADTVVCAAINRNTAIVYREFAYFKLPDDGNPRIFTTIAFHPARFGVEP